MNIINYNHSFRIDMMKIEVLENQQRFASSFERCLELHQSAIDTTELLLITLIDAFIGYALLRKNIEYNNILIWHFAIDKNYQRRGNGFISLKNIVEKIHAKFPQQDIIISIKHDNIVMQYLCNKIGFKLLDKNDQEVDYVLKT